MNDQPTPALDQSKADLNLRAQCLGVAITLAGTPGGEPDFAIDYAREFYLFLSGQDPVIDVEIQNSDNVISMAEYLKDNAGRIVAPVDRDDLDV